MAVFLGVSSILTIEGDFISGYNPEKDVVFYFKSLNLKVL